MLWYCFKSLSGGVGRYKSLKLLIDFADKFGYNCLLFRCKSMVIPNDSSLIVVCLFVNMDQRGLTNANSGLIFIKQLIFEDYLDLSICIVIEYKSAYFISKKICRSSDLLI